jgi:2-isopropylmalate synthase
MDAQGTEFSAADLWMLFEQEYSLSKPLAYQSHHLSETEALNQMIAVSLDLSGQPVMVHGYGNGPIDAFLDALGLGFQVQHYEERSLTHGNDAVAIAIIELKREGLSDSLYGIGIHRNIVTASLLAILSAVNRAAKEHLILQHQLDERFVIDLELISRR